MSDVTEKKAKAPKKAAKKADVVVNAAIYRTLLAPVVTERSTEATQHNRVTFRVAKAATKSDIRTAVETLYKVEVVGVNTMVVKGKTKQFRGTRFMRSDWKKAIVRIKDGQTIDLTTAL